MFFHELRIASSIVEVAQLLDHGRTDARAGNRSDDRHFLYRGRCAAASFTIPASRPAGSAF